MKFMRKIKIWIRVLFWVVPKEIRRCLITYTLKKHLKTMSEEESKLKDMPYLKTNSFDFNQSMWDSRKNNDIDRLIKEISNSL